LRIVLAAAMLLLMAVRGRAEDADFFEIAKVLPESTISLKDGLVLSEFTGRPISVEYEVQGGLLLLFVVTVNEGGFTEVVFDGRSGSLEQVESLTDPDYLEDARNQNAAMAKADMSLLAALENVEKENEGYRAVSLVPTLDDKEPMVTVVLVKGTDVKTVEKKLSPGGALILD
jgi:hypothetical protein